MIYCCAIINKEVLDKKVFSLKKEALDYFNSRFGEDIKQDRKEKEERIVRSIARCDKKLMELEIEPVYAFDKISWEKREQELLRITNLKSRRKKELDKLHKEMESTDCYYVWSFVADMEERFDESEFVILRICQIYKVADAKYEVAKEVYKVVSATIEHVADVSKVFEKLPDRLSGRREATICVPKTAGTKKIRKFISQVKRYVLSEHKKREF